MNKRCFEIALVQSKFASHDSFNIQKMKDLVHATKKEHPKVQVILFPELCTTGYFLEERLETVADNVLGAHYEILSKAASEHNVYLCYGYVERGADGRLYNSIIFIHPNGTCIGNYRKIHLTPMERKFFTPGSDMVIVSTDLGNFALMICWDLAFPEMARAMALRDADVILAPSAWESPYQDAFILFGQARAIDNTVFLAACNHLGQSSNLDFFGQSSIYGPNGSTLIHAASTEAIITYQINLAERESLQSSFFTMLNERRPDLYQKGAQYYQN